MSCSVGSSMLVVGGRVSSASLAALVANKVGKGTSRKDALSGAGFAASRGFTLAGGRARFHLVAVSFCRLPVKDSAPPATKALGSEASRCLSWL